MLAPSNHLKRDRIVRLSSVLLILLTSTLIILTVENMLISFVLAFVVYYSLSPFVDALERRGLTRSTSVLIPFLALGSLIVVSLWIVIPLITEQLMSLESQLPGIRMEISNRIAQTEARLKDYFRLTELRLSDDINTWLAAQAAQISTLITVLVSKSLTSLTILVLVPFFAFFMLKDGRKLGRLLLALTPNNLFEMFLNLQHQINDQVGGYIRARVLESLIIGAVVWLGLGVIQFPYAFLLALFAAIMNLVPYIGPVIGAIPAVLIAFIAPEEAMTSSTAINVLIISGIYMLAQLIDVIFVIPLVVARIVDLHPVLVLLAILVGAQLMGILGMVISVPVTSAGKLILTTVFHHLTGFRPQS